MPEPRTHVGETGDLPDDSRSGELSLLLGTLFDLWVLEA